MSRPIDALDENSMSHPDCKSVVMGDVDDEGGLRKRVATKLLPSLSRFLIEDAGRGAAVTMAVSMPQLSSPQPR